MKTILEATMKDIAKVWLMKHNDFIYRKSFNPDGESIYFFYREDRKIFDFTIVESIGTDSVELVIEAFDGENVIRKHNEQSIFDFIEDIENCFF